MPPDESHNLKKPEPPPLKSLVAEKAGALTPSDTVEVAGNRMRKLETDILPVAEDRKLVGAVDEANPDWKIAKHGHDPKAWRVGEIMTASVVFCYEDEDSEAACRLMAEQNLAYLPVVDRQMRIVGIFGQDELREKSKKTDTPLRPTD